MMKRFVSSLLAQGEDTQALIPPVHTASDVGPTEDGVPIGEVGREPDTLYKTFQHSHPIFRAPDEPVADPYLENLVESDRPPQASAPSDISSTTLADKYPTLPLAPSHVVEAPPGSETLAALGRRPSSSTSREQHLADETPLCFRAQDGQPSDRAISRGFIPYGPPEVPRGDADFCRNDQQSNMEREKDSWSNGKGPDTSSPYTSKTEILADGGENGPNGRPGSRKFVYVLACFATIGGLLFGYDTGIVSGSMLSLKPVFKLNTVWQEVIVSGTIAAAAVFSLVSGVVCDLLGRRVTIMAASFIFAAGAVVMAVAPSKIVLLVGRIIVGAGIGFASMTVPVYVAEAAPPDIRGRLVTLNQLFITIGILISSIIAGAFHDVSDGWRYMLGLAAIPGVIQFVGFIFLPESPRWLISKGRTEDARKVLQRIRGNDNIDDELKEVAEAETSSQTGFVLGEVLRTPHVRKALFIGSGLQLFQQLCGINTVIYYSASILKLAGFPSGKAIWLVCVPNVVNFLSTFIGVWAVERFGRKILLVISFLGVVVALVVLAVGFQLSAIHSPPVNVTLSSAGYNDSCATSYDVCENCILNKDCGYCYNEDDLPSATCAHAIEDNEENSLYGGCSKNTTSSQSGLKWALGYCPTDYNWMAVVGLALFVFSFAPGLGPMPWTINSEIYPMWARGTGNAIATAVNWIFNLIVSFTFLTMTESITKHGTFWFFAGICFLGMIFTLIFVPETKNKSLEEVEELFMSASERKNRQRQREIKNDIVVDEKPVRNVTNTRL